MESGERHLEPVPDGAGVLQQDERPADRVDRDTYTPVVVEVGGGEPAPDDLRQIRRVDDAAGIGELTGLALAPRFSSTCVGSVSCFRLVTGMAPLAITRSGYESLFRSTHESPQPTVLRSPRAVLKTDCVFRNEAPWPAATGRASNAAWIWGASS